MYDKECPCCKQGKDFFAVPHPWEFIKLPFTANEIDSTDDAFKWFSDNVGAVSVRCGKCHSFIDYFRRF